MPIVAAAAAAGVVAWMAWRARSLSAGGAVAAWIVGTTVLWGIGWPGGLVLLVFFAPTSAISRLAEPRMPDWVDAKGTRRDAAQVLANGAVALAGGFLGLVQAEAGLWIVTGSLAAAAADTWATSFGAWSARDPVDVVRWTPVPRGTSGGVSLVGSLGGALGAMIVAAAGWAGSGDPRLGWAAAAAGASGMVADSVLGATVQGRYHCPDCGHSSERRRHRCGAATRLVGGLRWVNNDVVNIIATTLAGAAVLALWRWR